MTKPETKFKETEIETIPKGWSVLTLNQAVDLNPKRGIKKGDEVKFVAMTEVEVFNKKIPSYAKRKFIGGSRFKNGDTLMARITPCLENGKTAFVDFLEKDEVGGGSTEFIVLSGKNGVSDSDFVYYLTISPNVRNVAIKAMTGTSGRQRVENDKFGSYIVTLPSIKEQKQIAEILSSLDDKIELNRQINANLEKLASSLFKQWFVNFEFPNDDGKPYKSSGGKMINSELGEIPEGWKIVELGTIADIEWGDLTITKASYVDDGFNTFSASGQDGLLDHFDFDRTGIVISAIGANCGETWLAYGKWSCIKNTIRFWSRSNLNTEFLFILTKGQHFWPRRGSAQPFISLSDAREIKVVFPKGEIATRMNEFFSSTFLAIYKNGQENKSLSKTRDSLLPQLMSGRIRTKSI